nr:MAG TPA: hypothetical protein [Caudoviricetes sp.]
MPQGNNNKHRAQKIDIENRLQIIAPLYHFKESKYATR